MTNFCQPRDIELRFCWGASPLELESVELSPIRNVRQTDLSVQRRGRIGFSWPATPIPPSKLVFDKVFAISALIIVLPVMVGIAAVLWITNGRPILFRHTRIGKDGKAFQCLKFRTMVTDAEARLQALLRDDPVARQQWHEHRKLAHDPRISRIGRFLRRSSLDELPQFWNVLRGDMSIVGPRPISAGEIEKYAGHFKTYSAVRPGITGLWQTSGRSNASYPERVRMDVEYVENWSFLRDVSLAWRTLAVVLGAKGAV